MQALLVSELISSLGSLMSVLALPWFVLETTGSPGKMGLVLAAEAAPLGLFFVASGRLAARLGPRRTLLLCDLVWALAIGAIPALHSAGALSFPLLLALSFVAGIPWAAHYGSQDALVAELAGATQVGIARAKAVFQTVARLAYFLGPVLGGLLLAASSASVVLTVDAISFGISFAIVAAFVTSEGQGGEDEHALSTSGGWAFIRRDPTLRVITGAQMLSQAAFMAMTAAIPALAFAAYDRDAALAGALLGAWGGGAMLGGVIAFRLVASRDPLRLGAAAWLLQAVPLWAMVASPAPLWAVAADGLRLRKWHPGSADRRCCYRAPIPRALRPETLTVSSALVLGAGFAGLLVHGSGHRRSRSDCGVRRSGSSPVCGGRADLVAEQAAPGPSRRSSRLVVDQIEARVERVEAVKLAKCRADDHPAHDLTASRVPLEREEVERVPLSRIEADMQAGGARVHIVGPFSAFFRGGATHARGRRDRRGATPPERRSRPQLMRSLPYAAAFRPKQ